MARDSPTLLRLHKTSSAGVRWHAQPFGMSRLAGGSCSCGWVALGGWLYPLYCSPTWCARPPGLPPSFAFSPCRDCAQCASLIARQPAPFSFWPATLSRRGWGLQLVCGAALCKGCYLSRKFCAQLGSSWLEAATDLDSFRLPLSSDGPILGHQILQRSCHRTWPVLRHWLGLVCVVG